MVELTANIDIDADVGEVELVDGTPTVTVTPKIESVEFEQSGNTEQSTKRGGRVVCGYRTGDVISVAGSNYKISSVSYRNLVMNEPTELSIKTEAGLNISGPVNDVLSITHD